MEIDFIKSAVDNSPSTEISTSNGVDVNPPVNVSSFDGKFHFEPDGEAYKVVDGALDRDALIGSVKDTYARLPDKSPTGGPNPKARFLADVCTMFKLSTEAVTGADTLDMLEDVDFDKFGDNMANPKEKLLSKEIDNVDDVTDPTSLGFGPSKREEPDDSSLEACESSEQIAEEDHDE